MRSKRTDRKSLKAELESIRREYAELKARIDSREREASNEAEITDTYAVNADAERTDAPPIILSGGYPAKASVRTAKSLKEAKEILMSSTNW